MQIQVIIRWSSPRLSTSFGEVCNVFRRLECLITGHREEVALGQRALSLRCTRCGWKSPGWTLDDPQLPDTVNRTRPQSFNPIHGANVSG
jgi:hypothetical protein